MLQDNSNRITGSYYTYQYIDQGAQFRVYAIATTDGKPTGRVIKVPLDFTESRQVLAPHLERIHLSDQEIDNVVHHLLYKKQQLPALLQGIFAENPKLMGLMGNLRIVPRMVQSTQPNPGYFLPLFFTQDLITPMAHFMHRFRFADLPPYKLQPSDVQLMERLIQQIIKLHHLLWEYGIFECGFKLENIGVRQHKHKRRTKTIFVDMGEYTLDRNEAEAILTEQRWRNALNVKKTDNLFVPSILHQHYIDVCNKSLTVKEFNRHWQKRSTRIEKRSNQILRVKEFFARDHEAINLWMQRQTLSSSLYLGVPEHRIDDLQIPQNELAVLLNDYQATGKYLNHFRRHEDAERTFFIQQQAPTDPRQLGNYILRQPEIRPVQ